MPTCRDDLDCLQELDNNVFLLNERFRDVVSLLTTRSDLSTYLLIPILTLLLFICCVIAFIACRLYRVVIRVRDTSVELITPDRAPLIDS